MPDPYDLDAYPDWLRLVAEYGEEAEYLFHARIPTYAHERKPQTADEARAFLLAHFGPPV